MSKATKIVNDPEVEFKNPIHFVPVETEDYDGTADAEISTYFEKRMEKGPDGGLSHSKVFDFPEGFSGLVLKDGSRQRLSVKDEKSFTYWNYDKDVEARDDGLRMAMDWIPLSNALHSA
ncbi:Uncharacterized protein FKW44_001194 [Caligus rogercresseyi]|uniref:Uncharacterized protein n=1 Tax=Caligus rogercresseyi TaxID=217165 RepID=A0A7T8KID7_CALRO|nr:Uncharacterized protein FKW44_001194 [Caligus rogercresseyi]